VAQLNELVASHQVAGASNGWADWEVALQTLSDQMDLARQQYGDSPPSNYPFAWPVDFQSITDPALPEDIRRQTLELMEAVKAAGLHDQLARAAANDSAYRVFPPTDRLIEILLPELGH